MKENLSCSGDCRLVEMPGLGGGECPQRKVKRRVELGQGEATFSTGNRPEEIELPKRVESQMMPPQAPDARYGTAECVSLALVQCFLAMSPFFPFRMGMFYSVPWCTGSR